MCKVFFFFCCAPLGAATFRRGQSKKKKKHHPGCFFLLRPRGKAGEGEAPCPWVVFFFAAAPRGRSLTHCGPGWRCLPLAGVVFFFFCCGPARTGVVFFLLWPRPDAHSLTVGWGDFGKSSLKRPGGATAKKKNTTSASLGSSKKAPQNPEPKNPNPSHKTGTPLTPGVPPLSP